MLLKGKTIVVTGANRGLGWAVVKELAKNGANVIAHARVPSEEFERKLADVRESCSIVITPIYFDVSDRNQVNVVLSKLLDTGIRVTGLVNNVGVAKGGYFQMMPIDVVREVFDVNFFGLLEVTQPILRQMIRDGGGSIVNVGSTNGLDLQAGQCAYGTSKAALVAFTKTLSSEVGMFGVRVNAVAPGLMNTDMGRNVDAKTEKHLLKRSSMNRRAEPEEVASMIAFLLSDKASFVNGQIISIDGGRSW